MESEQIKPDENPIPRWRLSRPVVNLNNKRDMHDAIFAEYNNELSSMPR